MKLSRSHVVLGISCVGLITAIAVIEIIPDPALQPASPTAADAPGEAPVAVAASTQTLADLRSRPPFWSDRHVPAPPVIPVAVAPPPPPPPPPASPPPPPSSELTLVGIVNGPEGRIAILRQKSTGKLERHVEGDAVNQWALRRILVDRVVFVGGGSETELLFPPPGERGGQPVSSGGQTMPFSPVPLQPVVPRR